MLKLKNVGSAIALLYGRPWFAAAADGGGIVPVWGQIKRVACASVTVSDAYVAINSLGPFPRCQARACARRESNRKT